MHGKNNMQQTYSSMEANYSLHVAGRDHLNHTNVAS